MIENVGMESEHQERGDLVDALRVSVGALAAALAAARVRLTEEQCNEIDGMLASGTAEVALVVVFDGGNTRAEIAMVRPMPRTCFPDALMRLDGSLLGVVLSSDQEVAH